jgi:DNA-binding CsgD family transcriptional regulator
MMNAEKNNNFSVQNAPGNGCGELSSQNQVALLTPREYDLYLLLLEGFTLKECAEQLSIKYSTANTHMTGIYKKLGVNSRAELIINYRAINK